MLCRLLARNMASFCTGIMSVPLLMLVIIQGCIGENQGSLDRSVSSIIVAMNGVGEALECFAGTTKEILQFQHQNTEALRGLQSLTEMILEDREQIKQQKGEIELLKQDNTGYRKVEELTNEVEALKSQLGNKDQLVSSLSQEIYELKMQLDNKDKEMALLTEFNTELKKELAENKIKLESRKFEEDCEQKPHLQEIKKLAQDYSRVKDWNRLKTGLQAILEHDSVEYRELQAGSLWFVGVKGYIKLASLLLCARMPADTTDTDGDTMLQGAALGGHMDLVKLLLDHGADVNMEGYYDGTPLIRAAHDGHLDVVEFLVQSGADTTAANDGGKTALDIAREERRTAVVEYLEQLPH